jgi:hypothetical protein
MEPLQVLESVSVLQAKRRRLSVRGAAIVALIASAALFSSGCCKLIPWALAVDPSLTGNSDANGMLEPGETVVVAPTWSKSFQNSPAGPFACSTSDTENGTATSLTGLTQADYAIGDPSASYGTFAPITSSNFRTVSRNHKCANCYEMFVSTPTARPASHWDATFTETLGGTESATKTWTLHVGDSFTDVPRSYPFYQKIEMLLHKGITSGCSATEYCPSETVSRGQMAIFLARTRAGGDANVPDSATLNDIPYNCTDGGVSLFDDVAPTDSFCKHVHYIAAQNITRGCAPSSYCPNDVVTRLQMAALTAKATLAPGGGAAVLLTYGPDPVTGLSYSCDPASPNIHFTDVPEADPFCKHVHYLWARGIVGGCSTTSYCPASELTQAATAKFLVNAFKLTLYGP